MYSVLYRLYKFIKKVTKFSILVMFSSWYQSLSFSKSLLCPAFIVGTFPMQPSLLYIAFNFWNFCAAFIVAPNIFFNHSSGYFVTIFSLPFLAFIAGVILSRHCCFFFFLWPLLPLFLDCLLLFHQHQSCRTPYLQLLKENRLCFVTPPTRHPKWMSSEGVTLLTGTL